LGNFIIDSPGIGQDWETIKQTVNDLPKKLARLSELQNAKADLDARLSKFGEPFADPK